MSHIWVPRAKIIEPLPFMLATACGGRFKLTAIRPDGRERPLTGWFSNIVLDQGLDLAITSGDSPSFLNCCRVGTGNTAPANAQTNLIAHVAGTSNIITSSTGTVGTPDFYSWKIATYRFAQGAAAGNLAEVGIGNGTGNAANLFSRELIRDGGGSPTTVTVLGDEFLDVSYEHRLYAGPLVDVASTVTISGVVYDTVARAAGAPGAAVVPWSMSVMDASVYSGALGAVSGFPGGASSGASSTANLGSYVNGNFFRDYTASWGLGNGNVGGCAAMAVSWRATLGGGNAGAHQISFSPSLPKDGTKLMTLNVRRTFTRKTVP
ncbi:MAG: hypothetical protein ACREXP_12540 [Steroidobacteraceae bacterium]